MPPPQSQLTRESIQDKLNCPCIGAQLNYQLYPLENIFICECILSITHLGVFGGLHSVHVVLNIVVSTTLKQDER